MNFTIKEKILFGFYFGFGFEFASQIVWYIFDIIKVITGNPLG